MPVSVGTIAEPKKKTNHMHVNVIFTLFKNGIGSDVNDASKPIIAQRPKDFFDVYPPRLLKVTPPMMTPIRGAVKHVKT